MATKLLYNQTGGVPFISEVAFDYKKDTFKIHVNVLTEKDETILRKMHYLINGLGRLLV